MNHLYDLTEALGYFIFCLSIIDTNCSIYFKKLLDPDIAVLCRL